ncbi:MAG: T9SS type A sorting domain-containing protein [Chlorobi bacterium]|nr:T9SS type A sorting domain-containing protein [Chlorobiota bacterium]MCI0714950.1 T9SS type A sorting domain-containing protein [Chlorobiota bacterium]
MLVKGCSSAVTSSGKFTSGIITEYCPSNGVIVVDNTINNVTTGISVIQSSPYIARNTITGQTSTGKGIYLDNSNGTIEYNTINNFDISIQFLYSSPYLLKNTLSDADEINVGIKTSSVPVMRPVISGSTLLWLGGNNYLNGTPSEAAITLESSAYPLIDSGYNVTNITSTFSISGELDNDLYARVNYWEDPSFEVTGGTVYYEPAFDGSSLPSTDYYNLNSLGFGLYDTVYVKDLGDNPTAQLLFMQAYNKEMAAEYEDAITLYKEVVSEYKTSSFAPVSLSRIFNCLEKNNSTYTDYQTIHSYYSNIKNSSAYPTETRDLAEDFAIKSKVKRNLYEEAIADYHTIYQNNQNNSKGQHALINELCLINMSSGGDNPNGNNSVEEHKYDILSLIIGEEIKNKIMNSSVPFSFKLYQNYPNPFNPVSRIKYDIPKHSLVKIVIYDLLGREVKTLINELKEPGFYEASFDGANLASGVYIYRIQAGTFVDSKKMVLIK